jgi:hypothetical protein
MMFWEGKRPAPELPSRDPSPVTYSALRFWLTDAHQSQ